MLTGSVGRGGDNRYSDVRRVQELLNGVSVDDGGPARPLEVDGSFGPQTAEAIRAFQLRQFPGVAPSGMVALGHPAFAKLLERSRVDTSVVARVTAARVRRATRGVRDPASAPGVATVLTVLEEVDVQLPGSVLEVGRVIPT